jgi:alpha-beta hydrolase superfamily lysophospholipase
MTFATLRWILKHLGLFIGYGLLCMLLALAGVYALYLRALPDLQPWHTADLDAEFEAADSDRVKTLADYRGLEDRLFAQLDREVYERVPSKERRAFNRYSAGSRADPRKLPVDWNRTFELNPPAPRGGVLLLHGMSDSPYSLRALGEHLHARGYRVVGLRLPGHGTAPSGLLRVRWQDMAAAVRLAARDLRARLDPEQPLYMIGYSNGAALAMEYALARMQGEALPQVDRVVLLSPAIGVARLAALAVWQGRVSVWLDSPKAGWNDMGPEYDPYKYKSFAVNAGDQVYRLTQVIARRLDELGKSGPVHGVPRILAFQSIADATVSTPAVIDALFRRLAPEGHQLVLFDINRYAEAAELFAPGALVVKENLLDGPPLPFDLTVLGNADSESFTVDAFERPAQEQGHARRPTGLAWPRGVYSLSHVALPFSPEDPVYGARPPAAAALLYLGRPELRGERGLLAMPANDLIRLRHNPFFGYVQACVEVFLDESGGSCAGVLAPASGRL